MHSMDSYIMGREAQDRARVSPTATTEQLRARLSELSRLPSTPSNLAERGAIARRLGEVRSPIETLRRIWRIR